jgi:hypothetical protein
MVSWVMTACLVACMSVAKDWILMDTLDGKDGRFR